MWLLLLLVLAGLGLSLVLLRASGQDAPRGAVRAAAEAPLRGSSLSVATVGVLLDGGCRAVLPGAAAALGSLLAPGRRAHLITLLPDARAEAGAAGLLESAGLVGPGGVPRHRALFCTTRVGSLALARQLAADLHVEGCADTAAELRRFGARVLLAEDLHGWPTLALAALSTT